MSKPGDYLEMGVAVALGQRLEKDTTGKFRRCRSKEAYVIIFQVLMDEYSVGRGCDGASTVFDAAG